MLSGHGGFANRSVGQKWSSGHLFVDDIEKAPVRSDFWAEALFDLLDTIKRQKGRP
jgi:hypothetical protein